MNQSTDIRFKEIILCFLSGIILVLPFTDGKLWFLSWFGYVPLFIALKDKLKSQAFLLSFFTGLIFWSGTVYWLAHVTLIGMIALVLYLALYFGIFGLIISTVGCRLSTVDLLFIPSLWVILEYIRSHLFTGFPWALLGYSQHLNIPVIQIADISGAWGVSFVVMLVNTAIYSLIAYRLSFIARIKRYSGVILCIIVTLAYGYYKLYYQPSAISNQSIKISVIQANIPQELKWNPQARDYIVDKYLDISLEAMKAKPGLIIWPEAALPVVLEEEPYYYERVKDFVKEIKTPLLLGAVTERGDFYYNSALLVSGEGRVLSRYDKLHLVPFGEYIPLKKIFAFLEAIVPIGDFSPGKDYALFQIPDSGSRLPDNFAVLICFEDLFPELSRNFVKRGADLLVNITNDAWFKKTPSPYQHLAASVFRAVENRVALVRAANTGVSGFIAPTGKILSLVSDKSGKNIFVPGYKTQEISLSRQRPGFYNRYGDIFVAACLLFVLCAIIIFKKKP